MTLTGKKKVWIIPAIISRLTKSNLIDDAEHLSKFSDHKHTCEHLPIPDISYCQQSSTCEGTGRLSTFFMQVSYSCRYRDMMFGPHNNYAPILTDNQTDGNR